MNNQASKTHIWAGPWEMRSLISTFVIRCLDSIISLDSIAISRLTLASEAAQAGLCLAWSETPEETFCRVVAHIFTESENQCTVYTMWTDVSRWKCRKIMEASHTEKEHTTSRRHKVKQHKRKPRGQLFPSRWPQGYPKQNHQIVRD